MKAFTNPTSNLHVYFENPYGTQIGAQFPVMLPGEGTVFDISSSGLSFIFNCSRPTAKEIKSVSSGSNFEIRSMVRNGVLWIFVKCGSLPWVEAPYTPHLSRAPYLEEISNDTSGYALTLYMVDAVDNTIKHMRLVGLGNRFSKKLRSDVEELINMPFNPYEYNMSINEMQRKYTTEQMAKMCSNYFKLRT